jgi:hypothetical protein
LRESSSRVTLLVIGMEKILLRFYQTEFFHNSSKTCKLDIKRILQMKQAFSATGMGVVK